MSSKQLVEKLSRIQAKLKAPKSQFNKFGNYAYRSCEDILEAVKPLLAEENLAQTISDEVVEVGSRIYVKATVTVTDGESSISNTAFAREAEDFKGMSPSQITGATSSYSRKYALNGMYAIDDTKDADATNTHGKESPQQSSKPAAPEKEHGAESTVPSQQPSPEAPGKRSFRKPKTVSEEL